jgi:RHS repeat-associated protein
MGMPGRKYSAGSSSYRYGFNGKEKSSEIASEDYDFEARIYDARLGRFLSTDPDTREYAWQSPYTYHRNSPIVSIDFEGRGDPPYTKSNVHFVPLHNPFVAIFLRQDNESFTSTATKVQTSSTVMYSINMQQYESTSLSAKYNYATSADPGANSDFKAQGSAVADGKVYSGRSSPKTFYFAQSAGPNPAWSAGQGDAPVNSAVAFGGGIPIVLNGLAYGETNAYKAGAPAGLSSTGDPGAANQQYLTQRSNSGYALQNDKAIGKSIVAFNSKTNDFLIISQQNGISGMTLDEIRDYIISKGFDNALSFDGSTSATLVSNSPSLIPVGTYKAQTIVTPAKHKNNTIPVGATFIDNGGGTPAPTKKKKG